MWARAIYEACHTDLPGHPSKTLPFLRATGVVPPRPPAHSSGWSKTRSRILEHCRSAPPCTPLRLSLGAALKPGEGRSHPAQGHWGDGRFRKDAQGFRMGFWEGPKLPPCSQRSLDCSFSRSTPNTGWLQGRCQTPGTEKLPDWKPKVGRGADPHF